MERNFREHREQIFAKKAAEVDRALPTQVQSDPWARSTTELSMDAPPLSHQFLWEPRSKLKETMGATGGDSGILRDPI